MNEWYEAYSMINYRCTDTSKNLECIIIQIYAQIKDMAWKISNITNQITNHSTIITIDYEWH